MNGGKAWSEQEIENLKQYVKQGLPPYKIEPLLPGRNRNTIIGKIHRLGLSNRNYCDEAQRAKRSEPKAARAARKSKPKAERVKVQVEETPPEEYVPARNFDNSIAPDAVHISQLEHGRCKNVYEPLTSFMYCGQPVVEDSSWCKRHHAIFVTKRVVNVQSQYPFRPRR